MLHKSHDFVISNSDLRVYNQYSQSGIDILHEASSLGATMDSQEHYDRRCFPGTREQYISDITNWVTASAGTHPAIYWMRGPAGVGKSAIAQTCAENLQGIGYLGAAFFFTVRNNDNPLRLFTTIAYQLATLLPDYRALIDDKISKDKSIVKKKISSQFKLLIAEPFRELEKRGKSIGKRAIFIDGLDECGDKGSQVEIIEIIASSVQTRSAPFCWAIFSREEPQITSTFATYNISSCHYSVFLPISREADQEVELYLRGGFENILKRRNFLHLSSLWPTAEQIKKLVDAAAGLFAHPATILRFIDQHSYSGFKEALEAVLKSIADPSAQAISPYAELDKLYMLILQSIPGDVLPSMRLLLAAMVLRGFEGYEMWYIGLLCNRLGISETVFQSIYHHLQAVIRFHSPSQYPLDEAPIDLARSYYDQKSSFQFNPQLNHWFYGVHGGISFYHKSFLDFLVNPTRSSTFCVTSPAARGDLFDCYIQQHHYYASKYVIQGSTLVLAPGVASSSALLSWPQGSVCVDSFLAFETFYGVSFHLWHQHPGFVRLCEDLSSSSLEKLAKLDYRKLLLAGMMLSDEPDSSDGIVVNLPGRIRRVLSHSMFGYLHPDSYGIFQPTTFYAIVEKLEKLEIIRPYYPQLVSSHATLHLHAFSPRPLQVPSRGTYGCYESGHGDRSVVWYWEFDTEMRYFHIFTTLNYAEAIRIYETERFKMWEESWLPPSYVATEHF